MREKLFSSTRQQAHTERTARPQRSEDERSASGAKINNSLSGVTRSRSVPNWHSKLSCQSGANPRRHWLTARRPAKKILFHLCRRAANTPQSRAVVEFAENLAGAGRHGAAATECAEPLGFEKLTSTGKPVNHARKSGVEQGFCSTSDFEQSKRSAAEQAVVLPLQVEAEGKRPVVEQVLTLSRHQVSHLAFAILCQVEELREGREAENPEVQEAVCCLDEILELCIQIQRVVKS